jgi:hypothetical protein
MWEYKICFLVLFENVRNMSVKVSNAPSYNFKNMVGENSYNVDLKGHSTYGNRLFKYLHNKSVEK